MVSIEIILVAISTLLLISVGASKASARLGVPALLLFLVIGMLAGSDGPGGIYFDAPETAQSLGVIALALILFSGGLSTDINRVKAVVRSGLALSTIGVVVTALLVGVFAVTFLDFSTYEGILLGAIVSSTDAAAVFSVLRGQRITLKGKLNDVIELESGSNDPMAVFLTVSFIYLVTNPETSSLIELAPLFIQQMVFGGVSGYAFGRLMLLILNKARLGYDGLYPVLMLALALLVYGATAVMGGNGFLAIYIAGTLLGNNDFIHKNSLIRFHDGLAWLMQIAMFLTLGLQVFPSELVPVRLDYILLAFFLIFVVRPVGVFVALLLSGFNSREKIMISWAGLRGAAPIILATFPMVADIPKNAEIFNLVFFVVLISVLVQGVFIIPVAKLLRLHVDTPPRPQVPLEFTPTEGIKSTMFELKVSPASVVVGKQIVDLHLPDDVLVMLIGRGNDFVVPRGGTVLHADDTMLVLAKPGALLELRALIEGLQPGEPGPGSRVMTIR